MSKYSDTAIVQRLLPLLPKAGQALNNRLGLEIAPANRAVALFCIAHVCVTLHDTQELTAAITLAESAARTLHKSNLRTRLLDLPAADILAAQAGGFTLAQANDLLNRRVKSTPEYFLCLLPNRDLVFKPKDMRPDPSFFEALNRQTGLTPDGQKQWREAASGRYPTYPVSIGLEEQISEFLGMIGKHMRG